MRKRFDKWNDSIHEDIVSVTTPADKVIMALFGSVTIVENDSDTIEKAITRHLLGNPPGKKDSYGDAINWELLLKVIPENEDLYFISSDNDYASKLDKSKMNSYLLIEWRNEKNAKVVFYKSVVDFLKEHFKDIELKTEKEKEDLIEGLLQSSNFATTHTIISELNKYSGWTDNQVSELCRAALNNSQVNRIIFDSDVLHFYYCLLEEYDYEEINDDNIKDLYSLIDDYIHSNARELDDYFSDIV